MNEKKKFSVLYAEDEQPIREKYSQFLKRFCTNVYEAKDGEEAFKIYKEKRPDIMIVDINMPKMNGLDLVAKIRENDHTTKVIMLTAHSDTEYLLNATNLKLTKYLIKPVNREDLTNALNLAIDELAKFEIYSKNITYLKNNLYWDNSAQELYSNDEMISLTKNEKLLTATLLSKLDTSFSYDEIIYKLWPNDFNDKLPALKTLVKGLRKKLPDGILENIRSMGYKITS